MFGHILPIKNYIKEFLDRPILTNTPNIFFFFCNQSKDISDNFTLLENFEDFYNQV